MNGTGLGLHGEGSGALRHDDLSIWHGFLIGHLEGGLIDLECGYIGVRKCVQAPWNVTGMAGDLIAMGSRTVTDNEVELVASYLPIGKFGTFVTSSIQSSSTPPARSGNHGRGPS